MSHKDPLLCIFAIPKRFHGAAAVHQRNAVLSWKRLGAEVEVLLCGDDPGVADAARQFGVRHIPSIERNEFGTPLVSAAFAVATATSRARLLCYANADIILMSDFLKAIRQLESCRFLLCGRRWDVELGEPLEFESPDWEEGLRRVCDDRGKLHAPEALDYFAFPRGLVRNMPPFAVGRAMWDNWLVFHARSLGATVIDSTRYAMVVHQNHDYAHTPGGVAGVWRGPEARANRLLAREMLYPFTLREATAELTPVGLVPRLGPTALVHHLLSTIALAVRHRPRLRQLIRTVLCARDA